MQDGEGATPVSTPRLGVPMTPRTPISVSMPGDSGVQVRTFKVRALSFDSGSESDDEAAAGEEAGPQMP